ncbi:Heterokaryon incompatibility protein 6 OR allele [Paramyrothecium foliicola]|nr:Heterokaryon incompatibility protein 6 OR allele [Paramyrothecium foliicola]
MFGTAPWKAPDVEENLTRPELILKTDIFSLGLVFWSILIMHDAFVSFNLPLDPRMKEVNIEFSLCQAYFFIYIPLLIQNEARDMSGIDEVLLRD